MQGDEAADAVGFGDEAGVLEPIVDSSRAGDSTGEDAGEVSVGRDAAEARRSDWRESSAVVVPVHASRGASLGAMVIAAPLALASALLLACLAVVVGAGVSLGVAGWWTLLGAGFAVSLWLFARHARRLATVMQRACAVASVQWAALAVLGSGASAGPTAQAADGTAAALAMDPGFAALTGPLAFVMVAACLLGTLVAWRLERERQVDPWHAPPQRAWSVDDPV